MLVLYRRPGSPEGQEIEARLTELVLAHRVVAAHIPQPKLTEGDAEYEGADSIRRFLDGMEEELVMGRQFQSDACYLDPDNPDRCL